jgi:hypothetical protein
MKKTFVLKASVIVLFMLFAISNVYSQTIPGLSVKVNKKSFKPGSSGVLTITFKAGKGVKIPKEPQIEVNLSGDGITGNGLQDYSGCEGDYITSKTIKYNFSISADAESGSTIKLKGSVKFGYCSSETGICKIGNKSFSVKIKVQ